MEDFDWDALESSFEDDTGPEPAVKEIPSPGHQVDFDGPGSFERDV